MSHKALVDAKLVPRIDGGVNTNDAIFEVIWPVSVVTGSNLIQLRKANGLVDCGGPLTVWILVSFCLTTIWIDVKERTWKQGLKSRSWKEILFFKKPKRFGFQEKLLSGFKILTEDSLKLLDGAMRKVDFDFLADFVKCSWNRNTFDHRLISGITNKEAVFEIARRRVNAFRIKSVPLENHVAWVLDAEMLCSWLEDDLKQNEDIFQHQRMTSMTQFLSQLFDAILCRCRTNQ